MNERPTPETDAENKQFAIGGFTLDFCRKLERERDEAFADRDIARLAALDSDKAHDRMVGELEKVYKERDEAREELRTAVQERHDFHWELLDAVRERNEARELLSAAQNALDVIHLEVGGWLKKLIEYK